MVVHVTMNFPRQWKLRLRLLKMLWNFVGIMSCILKKRFGSKTLEKKILKNFGKKVRKIKGNTTVGPCIDGTSKHVDNIKCKAHCVATDSMLLSTNFSFSMKDFDVAIEGLNPGTGVNNVQTSHIKNSKRICPKLICKFYNKLILHTYFLHTMLKKHMSNSDKQLWN